MSDRSRRLALKWTLREKRCQRRADIDTLAVAALCSSQDNGRKPTARLDAACARQLSQQIDGVRAAGGAVEGLPDLTDDHLRYGVADEAFTQALARYAVIEWEGVLTADGSAKAPLNAATVGELMAIYPVGLRFIEAYLAPLERLDDEKNGLAPSPNGTSSTAHATAADAATTSSLAPKADADRAARAAPTM
ncbi:MAG TPA: hypothetical protein VLG66_10260 [Alphaproteobacteria bacterium]|nr:hypothetical protein [Alphaproteobacteria bacterium]